ncbi:hemerythrin domain-containing protein [Streptomyces sp. NPDC052721]|uniref:hemerythrin domain-containing protein n=1 Tax=Streptomyces sp. NPDC052721 TaxID=3154955 RepID=UPI00341EA093
MGTLTKSSAPHVPPMSLRVGKATAKTAKAAPAWSLRVARTLGGENAVDLLIRQHRQIRLGFLKAALPGPWRSRNFHQLMRLLAVHEAAEEAHVHPVARRALRQGRELAARRRHEEKAAKELLIALWRTGPDGRGYLRRLNEARRMITQHAAREEREEFKALRQAVSVPRLRMLGAEVKLTQAYAPTRPHRWVNNEATNKLAAPVLGPVDRALDAVRDRTAP